MRVLVYGGSGALGQAVVRRFKLANFNVISADFTANPDADQSILLLRNASASAHLEMVRHANKDLNAILSVAGGWTGGNATQLVEAVSAMNAQSVDSSAVCASLAATHLAEGGLLVLTGAAAALAPTPSMIAYGMAKAAVHHLVRSLGTSGSGIPDNSTCIAILPNTLDTPMNRKYMPQADKTGWTPLDTVADKLLCLANGEKIANGALLEIITDKDGTRFISH